MKNGPTVRPTRFEVWCLGQCPVGQCPWRLERLDLRRGHFARALIFLELEAHALTFVEASEACALNGRDVNEHICAAGLRLDEAEALLLVEPLYGAGSHVDLVFR